MEPVDDSGRRKQRDRRSGPRRADEGAAKPDRRAGAARSAAGKSDTAKPDGHALVPVGPAMTRDTDRSANPGPSANKATGSAAFAAQLLGQPGVKRGLKGGTPVLEGARTAYLDSEYLGKGERRAPKGVITKTEI